MSKPDNINIISDSALDMISEVDLRELELEEKNIKNAVLSMDKADQKIYKFLLK